MPMPPRAEKISGGSSGLLAGRIALGFDPTDMRLNFGHNNYFLQKTGLHAIAKSSGRSPQSEGRVPRIAVSYS
jgi:hypothetical protein